jgi:peroxiredoxin
MHRFLLGPLALLVLLSALRAEDKPKEEKPTPAAVEYRALKEEYRKALKESDKVFEKAATAENRQEIRTEFQTLRSKIVGRFLAFAETHPKDKEALEALFFVLHPDVRAERRDADRAVQLILNDHITSDRLGPILQLLAVQDFQVAEKPLRSALEKNPHHAMQAQACLSLAQITKEKADASPPGPAVKLTEEAEELFERVVTKFADVKAVAEKAKGDLFQIRRLAVGKSIPDIKGKDSDDKELKLSDYRGKVVVVSFWAEWCDACMKMVPHERSLVKRLEGKQFALLGVNLDPSREGLKKCEAKNQMTWRSFFDGRDGPISKEHEIRSMPTIYVIDAKGIIRYKGVRGEAMDRAVDQLLAELDQGAKPGTK